MPRSVTVEKVLKQFFENAKQTSTSRGTVAAREISEGLQHVFNSALGTALLYGFERFQYVELLQAHPDIPLTKLFGAEHLLRLFVMLPNQLMYVISHSDENSPTSVLVRLRALLMCADPPLKKGRCTLSVSSRFGSKLPHPC